MHSPHKVQCGPTSIDAAAVNWSKLTSRRALEGLHSPSLMREQMFWQVRHPQHLLPLPTTLRIRVLTGIDNFLPIRKALPALPESANQAYFTKFHIDSILA